MDKVKQKRTIYNDIIIKELIDRYNFKRNYILKSIRGDRTGMISIKIQDEYNKLLKASNRTINQKLREL